MNKRNNKRRQDSRQRMETAFMGLLQDRELTKITVTELCRAAGVNRTTFYANYEDIFALAHAVQLKLENEVMELYPPERESQYSDAFLKLFRHIRDNQLFYKSYFKLGFDGSFQFTEQDIRQANDLYSGKHGAYHMEFFRNGFNAVVKLWLEGECRESPEEMAQVIYTEYRAKTALFSPDTEA